MDHASWLSAGESAACRDRPDDRPPHHALATKTVRLCAPIPPRHSVESSFGLRARSALLFIYPRTYRPATAPAPRRTAFCSGYCLCRLPAAVLLSQRRVQTCRPQLAGVRELVLPSDRSGDCDRWMLRRGWIEARPEESKRGFPIAVCEYRLWRRAGCGGRPLCHRLSVPCFHTADELGSANHGRWNSLWDDVYRLTRPGGHSTEGSQV